MSDLKPVPVPAGVLQLLGRYMQLTGTASEGVTTIFLGQPKPKVDWNRFVFCLVSNDVEIGKWILVSKKTGAVVFTWRLAVDRPASLHKALSDMRAAVLLPIPEARPVAGESMPYPGFDDAMRVIAVEAVGTGEEVLYVMPDPAKKTPWREVVAGMLASGRGVTDVAKVFQKAEDGRIEFVWRIIWNVLGANDRADGTAKPRKDEDGIRIAVPEGVEGPGKAIHEDIKLRQRTVSVEEARAREAVSEAVDTYRRRLGLVQGEDGKWRVPLDPYGRVTRAVLFDPEHAATVPGIRTGLVTGSMLASFREKRLSESSTTPD